MVEQTEQTPRERLIAALTNQPFEARPGYLWTKLGDPLSVYGIENAVAVHTANFAAETSNFKVWLEFTDQPQTLLRTAGTYVRKHGGPDDKVLRWTINVQDAADAAKVFVAYSDAVVRIMMALGEECRAEGDRK